MTALYLHYPYCLSKCPYCDFNSHVRPIRDEAGWLAATLREMAWHAEMFEHSPLQSVFFGGGTPSLLSPASVEAVLAEAHRRFGFTNGIEITLEANPTSSEADKFEGFRAAGVNRVSLGVQSLRPDALAFLGREHSPGEALAAVEMASRIFARFSFDLIYARPGQSAAEWEIELGEALHYAGSHLSLYQLTIEPGTPFAARHAAGRIDMLEDDRAAELYLLTQSIMQARGLPAYEVSNHAAPGEESRHNLAYWQGRDYFGLGPGAHGRAHRDGARFATVARREPAAWAKQVMEAGHGQSECAALTPQERMEERLLMGLRIRDGLAWQELGAEGFPMAALHEAAAPLRDAGLLQDDPDRLAPTHQGWLVLNSLTAKLCENLLPCVGAPA